MKTKVNGMKQWHINKSGGALWDVPQQPEPIADSDLLRANLSTPEKQKKKKKKSPNAPIFLEA